MTDTHSFWSFLLCLTTGNDTTQAGPRGIIVCLSHNTTRTLLDGFRDQSNKWITSQRVPIPKKSNIMRYKKSKQSLKVILLVSLNSFPIILHVKKKVHF